MRRDKNWESAIEPNPDVHPVATSTLMELLIDTEWDGR